MTDRVTLEDGTDLLVSADRNPSRTDVDEVVVHNATMVHVERMGPGSYWLRIDRADGSAVILQLSTARPEQTPIRTRAEVER